jgi:predicted transcriptional regulator
MKRSKIQSHIEILQTLANHEKLIPSHITNITYLNPSYVNKCLSLLSKEKLIQELNENKKRKAYTITEKGKKVLEIARKIDDSLNVFNN